MGSPRDAAIRAGVGKPSSAHLEAPATGRPRTPLPALALSSLGLLDISISYVLGWQDKSGALALFYIGFLGICAPAAWVLVSAGYSRRHRLITGVSLATLLYLAYFLSSPLLASRFDETLHVGTLHSLLSSGRLFSANTMLPISPYYPGLELVAASTHWLTGLPVVACQFLVVLVSRVLLIWILFLLVERFTRSPRAAGVAVLLYCGSTQFYFFNAQFSYQTIAITFALGVIYLTQRAIDNPASRLKQLAIAAGPVIALTFSHHLTSWATVATLWIWALLHRRRDSRDAARTVGAHAALATVIVGGWTLVLASRLNGYLGPLFRAAVDQLVGVIDGSSKSRALFADTSGYVTPEWERILTAASVLVWLLLVLVSGWGAVRHAGLGRTRARWLPIGIAVTYPLLILARVSPTASDVATRATTFVYFAMALVIAAWLAPRIARRPTEIVVALALVLLLGGTIIGAGPDWSRVTGPYLVSAEQRSVDSVEVAASSWAAHHLPSGSRVAADETTNRLLVSQSDLDVLTALSGQVDVAPIFYAPAVDSVVRNFIEDNHVDFVIVDTRLSSSLPHSGSAYETQGTVADLTRITSTDLTKFEGAAGFVKIYDGPVAIYDTRGLSGTPVRPFVAPAGGDVGTHVWQILWFAALSVFGTVALRRRRPEIGDPATGALWFVATLMVIGALGAAAGYRVWVGSLLLTVVAGVGCWGLRSGTAVASQAPRGRALHRVSAVVIVMALAASAWLAISSQHSAIYPSVAPGHAVSVDAGP